MQDGRMARGLGILFVFDLGRSLSSRRVAAAQCRVRLIVCGSPYASSDRYVRRRILVFTMDVRPTILAT